MLIGLFRACNFSIRKLPLPCGMLILILEFIGFAWIVTHLSSVCQTALFFTNGRLFLLGKFIIIISVFPTVSSTHFFCFLMIFYTLLLFDYIDNKNENDAKPSDYLYACKLCSTPQMYQHRDELREHHQVRIIPIHMKTAPAETLNMFWTLF